MNIKEQSLSEILNNVEKIISNLVKHSEEGSIIQSEAELALDLIMCVKELTVLSLQSA